MLSSREILAVQERQSAASGQPLFLFDSISAFLAPILPFQSNTLKYYSKTDKLPPQAPGEQSRLRGICLEPSGFFSYYDFNHTALHNFSAWFDPCFPGLTDSDVPCPNGPVLGRLRPYAHTETAWTAGLAAGDATSRCRTT
jgi:hypothetical protein